MTKRFRIVPSTRIGIGAVPVIAIAGDGEDLTFEGPSQDVLRHPALQEYIDGKTFNLKGALEALTTAGSVWDKVDKDILDDPTVKGYREANDFNGALKSLVNAQKKIGQKGILVPGKDAGEEEWGAFFDAAGRPKDANEYIVVHDDDFEEDDTSKERDAQVKALFHLVGLTPGQAKAFQEGFMALQGQWQESEDEIEKEVLRRGQAALDARYSDRRQFEADEAAGLRFMFQNDEEAIQRFQGLTSLTGTPIAVMPEIREALSLVGAAVNEDSTSAAAAGVEHRYGTAREIEDEITREYAKAKSDPNHPGHPEFQGDPREARAWGERMLKLSEARFSKL